MNVKRIWLVLPAAVLPYIVLLVLGTIFLSPTVPFFGAIMEHVFSNNIWILVAVLIVYSLLAALLCALYLGMADSNKWDPLSLAKTAMTVKLAQIPAYISIFVLGVCFILAIFTIPFSIALFLFDCFALILTGLMSLAAMTAGVRKGLFTYKDIFWYIIFQLFFCADVIATVLFYNKLKRSLTDPSGTQS